MRIGELSRRTGLSASRIRFYEKRGLLPPPDRRENGYRDYPDSMVKRLGLIDGAQRLGFSLVEIHEALSDAAPDFPTRAAMASVLQAKLVSLDQHIREANARRDQIVILLREMGEG